MYTEFWGLLYYKRYENVPRIDPEPRTCTCCPNSCSLVRNGIVIKSRPYTYKLAIASQVKCLANDLSIKKKRKEKKTYTQRFFFCWLSD